MRVSSHIFSFLISFRKVLGLALQVPGRVGGCHTTRQTAWERASSWSLRTSDPLVATALEQQHSVSLLVAEPHARMSPHSCHCCFSPKQLCSLVLCRGRERALGEGFSGEQRNMSSPLANLIQELARARLGTVLACWSVTESHIPHLNERWYTINWEVFQCLSLTEQTRRDFSPNMILLNKALASTLCYRWWRSSPSWVCLPLFFLKTRLCVMLLLWYLVHRERNHPGWLLGFFMAKPCLNLTIRYDEENNINPNSLQIRAGLCMDTLRNGQRGPALNYWSTHLKYLYWEFKGGQLLYSGKMCGLSSLGSIAVLCKVVLECCSETSGCCLDSLLIAWNMDSHWWLNEKIFYQAVSQVPWDGLPSGQLALSLRALP